MIIYKHQRERKEVKNVKGKKKKKPLTNSEKIAVAVLFWDIVEWLLEKLPDWIERMKTVLSN